MLSLNRPFLSLASEVCPVRQDSRANGRARSPRPTSALTRSHGLGHLRPWALAAAGLWLGACTSAPPAGYATTTTAGAASTATTTTDTARTADATPTRPITPPRPLPALDVAAYVGVWHQLALYPNRFQAHCLDSTTATYERRADGALRVINRCRTARGMDSAEGLARPRDGARLTPDGWLRPASLEVSFLPAALRWTGIGWGRYDVLALGPDGAWALVSEPSREYLWVLARTPTLPAAQWSAIEARLRADGFDLQRLRREPVVEAPLAGAPSRLD